MEYGFTICLANMCFHAIMSARVMEDVNTCPRVGAMTGTLPTQGVNVNVIQPQVSLVTMVCCVFLLFN